MSEVKKEEGPTFKEIMQKASKSAIRGGTAGAAAMGANVACLMWMRTTVSTIPISLSLFCSYADEVVLVDTDVVISVLLLLLLCVLFDRLITNIATVCPSPRLCGRFTPMVVSPVFTVVCCRLWFRVRCRVLATRLPTRG